MFKDPLPEKVKAFLKKIIPVAVAEKFYLAGGAGLSLQIGHRVSEDLDFLEMFPLILIPYFYLLKTKRVRLRKL